MSRNGDFGGRAASPEPPRGAGATASPLFKQFGGMALGAAIAFAIGAGFIYVMKQVGKTVGPRFVEAASQGNPQGAIMRVDADGDRGLQRAHQKCVDTTATVSLTPAQIARANGQSMWTVAGEERLQRAAAYITCLATERQQRFCEAAHRQHLVAATRDYFKLLRQQREEWIIQTGGANTQRIMLTGRIAAADLRSPVDLPSATVDAPLLGALRALAAKGLVSTGDFGGFAGFGAPQEIVEAFKGVVPQQKSCS